MLASRIFTTADQIRFAAMSGDRNPMHLDAVQARRTPAGLPAVHGIHLLLWALDALAQADTGLPPMLRLKASFDRFVTIDEPVQVLLAKRTEANARLDLVVAGLKVAQVTVEFGAPSRTADIPAAAAVAAPAAPADLAFEDMEGLSGTLAFASPPTASAEMFQAASRWLGPRRLAALAASTLLVGMVCPGLHSIYSGLTVDACDESNPQDQLGFHVVATDPRFRLVNLAIVGGGLVGTIRSFARPPPVPQMASHDLAGVVQPAEFAGSTALVIGGSRGLGEMTAKLLAAGGAKVVITYRVGSADAEAVAHDIRAAGGICQAIPYDASEPAEPQLATLNDPPTHAYYFATPLIFRAQAPLFVRARLDAFMDVYADGFLRLTQALRLRCRDISLFYPSTVFVSERPRGMLEYAMAKAAGETLCSEMNLAWAPLHVTVDRLPRLPTDQTASIMQTEPASAMDCLLSVVREVQSWPRQTP